MIVRRVILFAAVLTAGCSSSSTTRATKVDPVQATPGFWLDQPAVASVTSPHFYALWDACRLEMRDRLFPLDREDYRDGVIVTQPVVSKQLFEPWRSDVVTLGQIAVSSLSTLRRTVRLAISKDPSGNFVAEPKVLVERFTSSERRLTAISEYHQAFGGIRTATPSETESGGRVGQLPTDYWYSIGRDRDLEKSVAGSIRHRLRG